MLVYSTRPLNTLQLIFFLMVLIHHVEMYHDRQLWIERGWTGNKWARGQYEDRKPLAETDQQSFLCHAWFPDENDKSEIRAQIWNPNGRDLTSTINREGEQPLGVLFATFDLRVKDSRNDEFELIYGGKYQPNLVRHIRGGYLTNFQVVKKSRGASSSQIVNRYSYNCLEVTTEHFVQPTYQYQEHFIAEGTVSIEGNSQLRRRLLTESEKGETVYHPKAKILDVYVKGHKGKLLIHETDTREVNFQIPDSPFLTASSSLMFCAWAGKHDLTMKVTSSRKHK